MKPDQAGALHGFLEHCEARWRYVQAANSGAIDREMERRLFWWAFRRYGHPSYVHRSPTRRNIGSSKENKKVIKNFLIASCLVLMASVASAQTPIVVSPSTQLQWFEPGVTPATAQACVFNVAKTTAGLFVPVVGPVTCVAGAASDPGPLCSVNFFAQQATIPVGSGSIVMTATCSTQTSLPSTPFAYLTVIIPAPPQGIRLQGDEED
jgi:hypothetical protein